ncbi:MAG: DUF368 domain-containing protein [Bacilli bacterium]|nr:DUF368 domain-containing protein [Bacilli bacterium]
MEYIKLTIKGFIMGIANIIPGLSGGTIALILGIYEKFIHSINNLFKDFKNNIKFLLPILIGIGISILTMSNVIDYSYKNFAVATTLFFMGLITGGVPMLYSKVKNKKKSKLNILIIILTFSFVIFMAFANKIFDYQTISFANMNILSYIILLIVGMIASATMIIPGVSGSLVLMLLGYYYPIIELIKNIFNIQNIIILIVFGIGVLLGIILISKLIEYLFKKHETNTYYGVLGFIYASIFAVAIPVITNYNITFNIIEVIIGLILGVLGYILAYKLGEK